MTEPRYAKALVCRRDLRVHDHAALYHALKSAAASTASSYSTPRSWMRSSSVQTGAWSSSGRASSSCAPPSTGWAAADRPARAARTRSRHWRGSWRCDGIRQPRLRAGCGRARPAGARARGGRTRASHLQGPGDLREGRGPHARRTSLQRLHRLQERLAEKADTFYFKAYPVERYAGALVRPAASPLPTLEQLGFERTNLKALRLPTGTSGARALFDDFRARIAHYHERRDYPAVKGPSYLSVHLRFGTISIRELARAAWSAEIEGRGDLAVRADLARLLLHDPAPPPARGEPCVQAGVRRHRVSQRRASVPGLVRGAHRLPAGGRRDAADQPDRLHAQPPAHGDAPRSW